ncbi:pectate lyase B [Paramyrothecium foliicola]|nr:pectate lyase B [Paramyrothecium foliicola]
MKFSNILNLALASFVAAAPTPTVNEDANAVVAKRASVTDTCNIGYASTNGGTTGGKGGATTTVSTLAQFTKAAESSGKGVVYVKGTIKGSAKVRVASDKTIVGAKGSKLEGVGLYVNKQKNVIIRNLAISKVKADNGDAINIQASKNVWVDHCDLSSDQKSGKDYYDGLLDINHGSDWVTVSNTFLHDHYKTSLVGHSDSNSSEDKGKLHVTYANNYWYNVNSRNPSVRFGTAHIYNNYYLNVQSTGVNTRMGAQVRVESTVFDNTSEKMVLSVDSKEVGYATTGDISWGKGKNSAPAGKLGSSSIPYAYTLYGKSNVKSRVYGTAGQTLSL